MHGAHHVGGPSGDWLAVGKADQRLRGQVENNLRRFRSEDPMDSRFIANADAMILDG
jgi:hypothetical protein